MDAWKDIIITIVCSLLASSGFWAVLSTRKVKKDARTTLLLEIAQDFIINKASTYLAKGYLTKFEFEHMMKSLYGPYISMGGNGLAKKMLEDLQKMPIDQ